VKRRREGKGKRLFTGKNKERLGGEALLPQRRGKKKRISFSREIKEEMLSPKGT